MAKPYSNPVRARLSDFVTELGKSENWFVKACGLSAGWWNTDNTPSCDSLIKIAKVFPELDMNWVIKGVKYKRLTPVHTDAEVRIDATPATTQAAERIIDTLTREVAPYGTTAQPSIPAGFVAIPRDMLELLQKQLAQKDAQITARDAQIQTLLSLLGK